MISRRLASGWVAALILLLAISVLPLFVPGYSSVRQTVSEIGETGSVMRWPFTGALVAVAACLIVFAAGAWDAMRGAPWGRAAAIAIGLMGVSVAGVGWFAYPHPLHNVFGMSELIGYAAPLIMIKARAHRAITRISMVFGCALMVSLALNLGYVGLFGGIARAGLRELLEPCYGLVQRSLFAVWFSWCALVAWSLARTARG